MNKVITAGVATVVILGSQLMATSAVADTVETEKCYGVVKAGQNDCATKTSSCVGASSTDSQKDAFVAVPKGLCGKLSGGSLTSS